MKWLIAGCIKWIADGGLNPPAAVLAASADYFDEEDIIGEWVDACLDITRVGSTFVSGADLWADFKSYCSTNGIEHGLRDVKSLTIELVTKFDIPRARTGKVRGLRGVTLKAKQPAAQRDFGDVR
jgi:putative DNA primase/helicase